MTFWNQTRDQILNEQFSFQKQLSQIKIEIRSEIYVKVSRPTENQIGLQIKEQIYRTRLIWVTSPQGKDRTKTEKDGTKQKNSRT